MFCEDNQMAAFQFRTHVVQRVDTAYRSSLRCLFFWGRIGVKLVRLSTGFLGLLNDDPLGIFGGDGAVWVLCSFHGALLLQLGGLCLHHVEARAEPNSNQRAKLDQTEAQ